jgi:hypothetical protein
MIRKAALTVRLPGASTTPATSTSAWSQTGAVKKHRNAAINETKAGGASDAAAGEEDRKRCFVIASVESNRVSASTIRTITPQRHFDSAVIASMTGTVGHGSG